MTLLTKPSPVGFLSWCNRVSIVEGSTRGFEFRLFILSLEVKLGPQVEASYVQGAYRNYLKSAAMSLRAI